MSRDASSLVIAEHDNSSVIPLTYNTISAAQQLGGDVTVLVAGKDCTKVGRTMHHHYLTLHLIGTAMGMDKFFCYGMATCF